MADRNVVMEIGKDGILTIISDLNAPSLGLSHSKKTELLAFTSRKLTGRKYITLSIYEKPEKPEGQTKKNKMVTKLRKKNAPVV